MASYLIHIGLYSVAVATQLRFGHQIRHLLDALPAQFAQPLSSFARPAASMPVMIADQLRITVDDFSEQWRDYYAQNIAHIHDGYLDESEA